MSKQHKLKHYTIDDLHDAREDEQAKFMVWQCKALRELRACLLGQDDQTPKRSAGASSITLKTFTR
jgi:hypothetical protein